MRALSPETRRQRLLESQARHREKFREKIRERNRVYMREYARRPEVRERVRAWRAEQKLAGTGERDVNTCATSAIGRGSPY
jgi:hypothetical protein